MTERFCRMCRGWHSLDAPWPDNCRPERNLARSDLPTPRLIRDGLDDVINPLDGKPYSSKSAYYRKVREAGCEIVGDDRSFAEATQKPVEIKTPAGLKDTLKAAWDTHS